LEDLEAAAAEDELAPRWPPQRLRRDHAGSRAHPPQPVRKPFPLHLPRERVIVPGRPLARAAARPDF